MHNYSKHAEQTNGNKYIPNFTLFQNFADSCLQNDPLFVISRVRAPLKKSKMGTNVVYVFFFFFFFFFWGGGGGGGGGSGLKYSKITHRYAIKHLTHISSRLSVYFICSVAHFPESVYMLLHLSMHAGRFDFLMSSPILIAMDNGRGHCAWWQSCRVPNQTHRGIKTMEYEHYQTH